MPLGRPLLTTLERMGCGGLVLDTNGQPILINETARRLLEIESSPRDLCGDPDRYREALKGLLRSDKAHRHRMDEEAWLVVRREKGRPLAVHAVPVENGAATGAHTVLVLVDLDTVPQPTAEALHKLFELTSAEAKLAIEISSGKSPNEIAKLSGVRIGTVRKQLASVFAKTSTCRQSELVALLARVAILP